MVRKRVKKVEGKQTATGTPIKVETFEDGGVRKSRDFSKPTAAQARVTNPNDPKTDPTPQPTPQQPNIQTTPVPSPQHTKELVDVVQNVDGREEVIQVTREQAELLGNTEQPNNIANEPTFQDQPAGIQAVQGALLDVAATGGAGTAKGAIQTTSRVAKATRAEISAQRIAAQFGVDEAKVLSKIKNVQVNNEITKVVKGLTPKGLASKTANAIIGLAGTDILVTWYSLDNVIGGAKFQSNEIVDKVKFAGLDPAEGMRRIEELREVKESATQVVELSTIINPTLWPFRKVLLEGAEADSQVIEQNYQDLKNQVKGGTNGNE